MREKTLSQAAETVIELYVAACDELFRAYGLTTRLSRQSAEAARSQRRGYASVLGATGDGIGLSSTINIDAKLLEALHPARGAHVSASDLGDWCRELNNQLVGRVKNKLLRYGRDVSCGLPVLITGNDIHTPGSPGQEMRRYFFTGEGGCLALTLAIVLDPRLVLRELPLTPEDEAIRLEGAHTLF
jgi:hypothetical protein